MSFDLIKKQKANIQKEKKRIAQSDYFRHPLAYHPMPKGREGATKEEVHKIHRNATLDAFCAQGQNHKNNANKNNGANQEFKIEPDRDAVNLFFSNMQAFVPGKKGSHVSDVFSPNRSRLPKKFNQFEAPVRHHPEPEQSYRGYNDKKATLMVRVNTPIENYNGGNSFALKDRLGDLDTDLPHYQENDIYREPINNHSDNSVEKSEEDDIVSQYANMEDKRQSSSNNKITQKNGTTFKLSFVKPDFNVKLDVIPEPVFETVAIEEEEEEEDIVTTYANNFSPNRAPAYDPPRVIQKRVIERPNIQADFENSQASQTETNIPIKKLNEISSHEPYIADLRGKSGRYIPIKNVQTTIPSQPIPPQPNFWSNTVEEEEEETNITRDYQPVHDYNPRPIPKAHPKKKSRHLITKLKSIWKDLKKREQTKILKMEFHSGQANHSIKTMANEYTPAESDFKAHAEAESRKPRSSWAKKVFTRREEEILENSINFSKKFRNKFFIFNSENAKRSATILAVGILVALTIPIGAYVQKVIEAKSQIEAKGNDAMARVQSAKSAILSAKPEEAQKNFETAYHDFLSASDSLDEVGGGMLSIIKVLPGGSKIASGENILEAGKHLTAAGQIISEAFSLFLGDQGALKKKLISTDNLSNLKEVTSFAPQERQDKAQSLTEAIIMFQDKLQKVKEELTLANDFLAKVDIDDLPKDKAESFAKLRDQLPGAINSINAFSEYSNTLLSLLGHNQSKQYLFLFQNNDEVRGTGGFIGTYGIMKINNGNIEKLSIDGIYNPDGQLKERVIPPKPIQKMSATWSMHDANWWPDFPKSAEKVAWFYEKTGGPTVDGVIAFTPKILEDLLKITGPINHEKYGVTVSADNFVELTQFKVEKDYDRQLNRPKQFLSDLAPIVLGKIFSSPPEKWIEVMNIFAQDLEERSIQMYFFDANIQKKVSDLGWSGEILKTPKDYLSVINTNISGLKTDKMIDQKINHQVEIKPDGSIVDTVTINRSHKGGKEKYEWYNAVNSNWLRVYVPKGSELLHAEGYTREVDSPPVDYDKLGFVKDEMVVSEEENTNIDPYTGTQVYEDSDKTVFANWTYVSPGETLTVKYSYLLPFKLRFDDLKKPADTYSLLVQKQAGDENSSLVTEVLGLDKYDSIYHSPDSLPLPSWKIDEKFTKDFFAGVVLVPKGTKID